jgi:cytochrome c-type biogenesis protein CcmH
MNASGTPKPPRQPYQDIAYDPAARPSRGLIAALSAIVLVIAVIGYAAFGTPAALRGAPPVAAASAPVNPAEQVAAMVAQLEARLQKTPDDPQGWTMLGRAYNVLGRYTDAVNAFKRVAALRPTDAQALADQADATAMANGRRLVGEPEQLINRALQLDGKNLKALALAGTLAFDRSDFAGAARLWSSALSVAEPGSELARNLEGGVNEARSRAGLPAASAAGSAPAAPSTPAPAGEAAAQVSGRVELATALLSQVQPGDTVFIFARAVDGPRAPLAILRKQVKDLPLDFTLDDSLAMSPALRLSGAKQVVIGARISKSGNAVAQAGDLQGLSAPVAVGTRGLRIQIADVVK